jgi:PST family polysaccharide transporter
VGRDIFRSPQILGTIGTLHTLSVMKPKSDVLQNLLHIGLGDGLSRLFSFVAFVYLARILGPSNLGLIGFGASAIALLFPIIDYGLGFVGTREVSRDPDLLKRYLPGIIFTRLFLAVPAFICYLFTAYFFVHDAEKQYIMVLYSLTLIPAILSLSWAYQATGKTWWFVIEKGVQAGLFLAGVLTVVLRAEQYTMIPVLLFCSSLIAATIVLVYFLWTQWSALIRVDIRFCIDLLKSSFKLFVPTVLTQLNFAVGLLLIVQYGSLDEAGFFSATSKIAVFVVAVPNLLWSSFYPALSRSAHSRESVDRLGNLLCKYAILIGVIPFVIGTAFSGQLMDVLFGQQYRQAALPFALFSVFASLQFLSLPWTRVLPAFGMERSFSRIITGGAVFQIALCVPFILSYGVAGAAISFVVSETVTAVLAVRALRRSVSLHIGRPFLQSFGVMALSCGVVAALSSVFPLTAIPAIVMIVVLYLALLLVFSIATTKDFVMGENLVRDPQ